MNELINEYLGKNCTIYTADGDFATVGVIRRIVDSWMEVETKKGKKLINMEFVIKLEEKAEKAR